MIRSHAEYRKKLSLYVAALHAWGFRESHAITAGDYSSVLLETLERAYFIVNVYNELFAWTQPRQPWLVADNPDAEMTPPRGISAPVKPRELARLEEDLEFIFGVEFRNTASTAWKGADQSVKEPATRERIQAAQARLAQHIAAESRKLAKQMGEKEVLVLPSRVRKYRGRERSD